MNPAPAEKRLNEARQFLQQYNFSQAVQAYDKLTQQFPHKAGIWFEYGCAAGGAGLLDLVERTWRKALELEPNNSELLLQMGHRYQALRLPEKARSAFERAAAL